MQGDWSRPQINGFWREGRSVIVTVFWRPRRGPSTLKLLEEKGGHPRIMAQAARLRAYAVVVYFRVAPEARPSVQPFDPFDTRPPEGVRNSSSLFSRFGHLPEGFSLIAPDMRPPEGYLR